MSFGWRKMSKFGDVTVDIVVSHNSSSLWWHYSMTLMFNIHVFNLQPRRQLVTCLGFILFSCDCKQFLASHLALSETLPQFVMANVDGAFP